MSLLKKELDDNKHFELRVENDGEIIPFEMKDEIFKPFVRYVTSENNRISDTGIGLPLAKFLAEQHSASLELDTHNWVNCFILRLPIEQANTFDVR